MSNHGWVISDKPISAETIENVLKSLNESHFKGNLKWLTRGGSQPSFEIQYHEAKKGSFPLKWLDRYSWLESPYKFEMRHGRGGDFAWWVDATILNYVALATNGKIYDDGGDWVEEGKEDYYPKFEDFARMMKEHIKDEDAKKVFFKLEMDRTPPLHRFDF